MSRLSDKEIEEIARRIANDIRGGGGAASAVATPPPAPSNAPATDPSLGIFGTVSGGLLFNIFRDNEVWIGVILLILSVIGAAASYMIAWLPAASPDRAPIPPCPKALTCSRRSSTSSS